MSTLSEQTQYTHTAWLPIRLESIQAGDGVDLSITEEELDGILDRERVFASAAGWGDSSISGGSRWGKRGDGGNGAGWGERARSPVVPLPREGEMYDVVDELDASVLSSME